MKWRVDVSKSTWRVILCCLYLIVFQCRVADAATAKDDALDYQKCILQMRHISSDALERIMSQPDRLESRANVLANRAVSSCSMERKRLLEDLDKEGKTDQKYSKLIEEIEETSKTSIQARLLDLAARNAKGN